MGSSVCDQKSLYWIVESPERNGKKGEREREKKKKNQNVEKGKPGEEEEAYQSIIHTSHIQRQKGKGLSSCETPTQWFQFKLTEYGRKNKENVGGEKIKNSYQCG